MLTMNLEGLEMIAVLMVVVLFVKVLERFGLLAAGYDGKETAFHVLWGGGSPPPSFGSDQPPVAAKV